jgi:acyl carrier protein
MTPDKLQTLRRTIGELLANRGQTPDFTDDESLFDSGRLDSASAVHILLELESIFGVDLGDPDFDISQIDSFAEIKQLARQSA